MTSPNNSASTSKFSSSGNATLDSLLNTGYNKWGGALGTGASLSFSFPYLNGSSAFWQFNYSSENEPDGSSRFGLNGTQIASAKNALQSWANVANLSFTEVADTSLNVGDFRFAFSSVPPAGIWGWSYQPNDFYASAADVWINSVRSSDVDWAVGSFNFEAMMHEIGHGLGLKHPGNYNGIGSGTPPFISAALDYNNYTIMSYNEPATNLFRKVTQNANGSPKIDYVNVNPDSPMVLDMQAIQYLYGANTSYKTGNDIYTFDPATPFFHTIWDAGGTDTISVANFSLGCVINLQPGQYSSISIVSDPLPPGYTGTAATYNGTNNLGIAYNCIIENAVGGSGNDQLIGNSANNNLSGGAGDDIIEGGAGNDNIDGGTGIDTAIFAGAFSTYTYSYNSLANLFTVSSVLTGTDSITNVEYFKFSDVLKAANQLMVTATVPIVFLSSSTTSILEGNSGSQPLTFTVNLSSAATSAVTVNYATANGTATAGSDYTANSGVLTFAPGETSKTISVAVLGDTVVETNETFTLSLSSPSGATLGNISTTTATIVNDDVQIAVPKSTLSITPSNAPTAEGNGGITPYTFTVTRAGDLSASSSASWLVAGSGIFPANGADFIGGVLPSGTVIFNAGQSTATVTVNVAGDTVFEQNEGFIVSLANPIGASLGTSGPVATINQSASGGYGITEKFYTLIGSNGLFTMSYNMYSIPDRADIYLNGSLVVTTNGPLSGTGVLTIPNSASLQSNDLVRVVMTGTDTSTAWDYTVNYLPGVQALNYIAAATIINDDTATTPAQSKLDDFVVLQFASPAIVGADAGNDTYLISGSMVSAGQTITISDSSGNNSIQLANGLSIASSQVASNALKLTLSNGGTVTVLNANLFTYDVGGNTSAGIDNVDVTYAGFVQNTLGVALPVSGIATGGTKLIGSTPVQTPIAVASKLDDFVVLQFASPAIVGADAGNDTYLISGSMVSAGQTITISDSSGNNSIQLANGLSIASSQVASNALKLTLSNGGTVTVLNANLFTYDVGGNTSAGIDNVDVSYASFVQNTLGVALPGSGIVTGGAKIIGSGNATPLVAGSSAPATATSGADTFSFSPAAARALVANTQITTNQFDITNDKFQFDPTTALGVTTLATLNRVEGISVQTDPFAGSTLINFGSDANGDLVALTLAGITVPVSVVVNVI